MMEKSLCGDNRTGLHWVSKTIIYANSRPFPVHIHKEESGNHGITVHITMYQTTVHITVYQTTVHTLQCDATVSQCEGCLWCVVCCRYVMGEEGFCLTSFMTALKFVSRMSS